jgi:hypothetical protein
LPDAALADGDAVLVQETAEADQLAVRCGESRFEVADRGAADVAFVPDTPRRTRYSPC